MKSSEKSAPHPGCGETIVVLGLARLLIEFAAVG